MGRFWLGIGLLVVFLVLGLWVGAAMGQLHETIAGELEQASTLAQQGDMDKAVELAQQAYSRWQQRWHGTASVADHAPMDEIDGLFAQLNSYAKTGQRIQFAAFCARLSSLISAIGEAHSLSWWNLL